MDAVVDRRGFLTLLGAGAGARTAGAGAAGGRAAAPILRPGARRLARLDTVRVCNTRYYDIAQLRALEIGQALDVRFDYDPAFVQRPSAGFYVEGVKVGDAPRLQRQWFGHMLNAGRRLSARLASTRPRLEHDSASWSVDVLLDRAGLDEAPGLAVDPEYGGPAPREVEAFLKLVAGVFNVQPVWVHTTRLNGMTPGIVVPGEPLSLTREGDRVWFGNLTGDRVGQFPMYPRRLVQTMLSEGVDLGGIALPTRRASGVLDVDVAIYLFG